MTMQRLTIGIRRAAKYLVAGNSKLILTADGLQEAAKVGKLHSLQFAPADQKPATIADDPVAVAIVMNAQIILDARKARRPTAAQIRTKKLVMENAFRHVCRMSA